MPSQCRNTIIFCCQPASNVKLNILQGCLAASLSKYIHLTHWGRVTHICVSDLTSIGSDNSLSPGRRQAIIRTNAGLMLIELLGTNFSEILIAILIFSLKKMHLKVSFTKRRPFCLGLNVLKQWCVITNPCPRLHYCPRAQGTHHGLYRVGKDKLWALFFS